MKTSMTSMERVLCTLGFQEPDRVPFFLLLTMHGAKELGLGIREYFSRSENVVEGQLRMWRKYGHDALDALFHGPLEIEAWGGDVVFYDDGPPNSGEPFLHPDQIPFLEPPRVSESAGLLRVLATIASLKARVGDQVPIIGVAISPFSLPVMQLGFETYLNVLLERPDLFWQLMARNESFCVEWANAQLAAGATAICYFDPVSSPTCIQRDVYLRTGHVVASRTLALIRGPTATHFASGRVLPILDDVARSGTAIVGVSASEDLAELKTACHGRLTILGNLNGVEMRRWTPEEAEMNVRRAIQIGGPGGGFILSDNHGEIPYQVSDETLMVIAEAARRWGRYPIETDLE